MRILRFLPLLLVVAVLLSLPACGGKPSETGSTETGGDEPIKVAFITNNAHTFWKYAEAGCKAAEQELNEEGEDVEVIFKMPPSGTAAEQRRFIEDLQVQGVKAFAISPNNVKGQLRYFRSVNKKMPLLLVDSDVDDSDPKNYEARRYYLGTNNVAAGRTAGELLKEAAPDGGKFVIFVGKLDVQNAVERRKGVVIELAGGEEKCKAELAKLAAGQYPIKFGKYELLSTRTDDADRTKCQNNVEDELTRVKDLRAMVGLWEYNPPAMYSGVQKAKKLGEIALIGFDENSVTLDGIEKGHIQGTVVQQPFKFGYQAVKVMVAILKDDQETLDALGANAEKRVFVPHRKITKTEVEAFRKELAELLK